MFLYAFFWIVPLLFVLALIFIGVSIGARKEPDPGGRRPYAIYLLSVVFIAFLAAFVSVAGAGSKTVELIVTDYEDAQEDLDFGLQGGSGDEGGVFEYINLYEETRARDISALLNFALILMVALGLLVWHWNRLAELKGESTFPGSSAERTYTAFIYLTMFASLLVFTTSVVFGVLALGDVLFPEDLAGGPSGLVRDFAYAEIVAAVFAGAAAAAVFRYHWAEGRRLREEPVTAEPVPT